MRYFRVTFIPVGQHDKQWMMWQDSNPDELKKFFKAGSIISIEEVSKKTYDEYLE